MYCLINEKECFIRFTETRAGSSSGFRPNKTRNCEFIKRLQTRLHYYSLYKEY